MPFGLKIRSATPTKARLPGSSSIVSGGRGVCGSAVGRRAALAEDGRLVFIERGGRSSRGTALTEGLAVISLNPPHKRRIGHGRSARAGVEVKIADDGEILSRGQQSCRVTGTTPRATAQASIRRDGSPTGDIGEHSDRAGFLKIRQQERTSYQTPYGKTCAQPLEGHASRVRRYTHAVDLGDRRQVPSPHHHPEFRELERDAAASAFSGARARKR